MFLPNRIAEFSRTCKWASLGGIDSSGSRTMPKAYSADVRMRVIARVEGGASRREAAEQLDISPSAAVKWVKCFHETGSCASKPRGGSTSPLEAHTPGRNKHGGVTLLSPRGSSSRSGPRSKLIHVDYGRHDHADNREKLRPAELPCVVHFAPGWSRAPPRFRFLHRHRSRAVVVSWVAMFSVELTRRLRLTHHIFRPLVLAQTQIGRMAHLACRGPFREFDLSYKLR